MIRLNHKAKYLIAIALIINSLSAGAQIDVVPVTGDKAPDQFEGFYYALPKTIVRIEVWVDETEQLRGPFTDYAGRMLGITDVIKNNGRSYAIKGFSLSTYQEADPATIYFVRMPLKGNVALDLVLNQDATLRSLQTFAVDPKKKNMAKPASSQKLQTFATIAMPDIVEKIDTIVTRITIDTITFEKITFPKTYIDKSPEQKARQAADFILKLEEDRQRLISGFQEVNYSMESIKYMNEQIKELQNEYLALFKGKSRSIANRYTYIFVPEPGSENIPTVLFKYDKNRGILDKNSADGEPVTIQFSTYGKTTELKKHHTSRQSANRVALGVHYRIPEKALFEIRKGSDLAAENEFLVSQLGVVSFLPSKGVSFIEVHPQTGSLLRIKME